MKLDPAAEHDRKVHRLAREYLLGLDRVTAEMVDLHLSSDPVKTLEGVYQQLLNSAQTPNMKAGVIGRSIDGVERLGPVLCDFNPKAVPAKFPDGWEQVLDAIRADLSPRGQVRTTKRSIWPQFCMTVLSGAEFLSQFEDWQDFDGWVRAFDDPRSRAALAMLLGQEVHGIGFAVACDFLKELGHEKYAKPDVHLKKIFTALRLSSSDSDLAVFEAVARVAASVGETPYSVDKLFWLIGSGNFYKSKIQIGGHRDDFIAHAQAALGR